MIVLYIVRYRLVLFDVVYIDLGGHMSLADTQYLGIIENILEHGTYGQNRTGIATYKLPHQIMQFDLQEEFPILTTKFVAFKTAVKELLWIWQMQSNDVRKLQEMNVRVWDEWMREDGTIGKAYGYQIAKYKQLDNLIKTIKEDPDSRRMIVTLWNIEDLDDMALQPCAYETLWDVADGKLNCMLIQRSGDMGLGNNAHVYENHVEALREQLARRDQALPAPKIIVNPEVKDFYDFTPEDVTLDGYEHLGKLSMTVAV